MAGSRLDLIAPVAPALLIGARGFDDLSGFDPASSTLVQGSRPDHDALAGRGFTLLPTLGDLPPGDGTFRSAVVFLPRARALYLRAAQAGDVTKAKNAAAGRCPAFGFNISFRKCA